MNPRGLRGLGRIGGGGESLLARKAPGIPGAYLTAINIAGVVPT